ncbi:MAG: hypothetical protein GX197_07015 [Firmicutes bacterium]|nr:hypothetical protein [Bacillota bacterium]
MSMKDWILLGVLLVAALWWWLRQRRRKIQGGKVGSVHKKAVQLLEAAGYEVLKATPTVNVRMEIDGQPYPFAIKSDLLVKRGGRLFVAHVRKEAKAIRLHSKVWRERLLRDALVFRVSGVVMIHVEKEKVQEVCFHL